ncbi:DUF445 domain-containing protein [Brevibacillus panacihumi]|uniref:DUF445 family protein n=1 Tax=Brevibacillus panacihumi TaxID=497735 RepID=A0A3M8BYW7_9BACL|nr:DUF445 family protein [Brevibacillus panacihumi]RNB68640.1 DUF445 family protein [Brevibacillus panacihumi]
MNSWLLLVNIAVGSAIGGVTNELAIRMLFRPLRPWYIGRWRVPFTPGLIPSRRDDIAIQMGRLVEDHLLTTEGIKRAIAQGGLENNLRSWLEGFAAEWMSEERNLRQILQATVSQVFDEEGKWSDSVRTPVLLHWNSFVERTLRHYEDRSLRELLSPAGVERVEAATAAASQMLLSRLRGYLHTSEGQHTLQEMIRGLLGGGGGMFGGLVGMFLGDDKIINKILPRLDEWLQSPELAQRVQQFLKLEADKLLEKKVGELVEWVGRDQVDDWAHALFSRMEAQSLRFIDEPLSRLTAPFRETILTKTIPRLSGWMVQRLESNVERIVSKISVRDIVTRQVEGFPMERIEEMVIGISGKEFRMITLLGFILGGMIGLVQGLLALWLG